MPHPPGRTSRSVESSIVDRLYTEVNLDHENSLYIALFAISLDRETPAKPAITTVCGCRDNRWLYDTVLLFEAVT